MIIVIEATDTDNIIGIKEDITMRLEEIADIKHISIYDDMKHLEKGEDKSEHRLD